MSLFFKIFLWFWLAMALVVGALMLVSVSTQNEPVRRQWQTGVADSTKLHTQTAKQFYENEGQSGLESFLQRLENSERIVAVGFFVGGSQLAGGNLPKTSENLIVKTLASNKVEYDINENETLFAEKVQLKNGENAVFVLQWEKPRFPPTNWARIILQILAALLTTGIVCYGLARYLTQPISKLQFAVQNISKGDFQTAANIKRNDEFGKLAADFNQMAQRIESLISSQKILNRDVSHELRTPLARLGVALELARARAGAEVNPYLTRIEREAEIINQMISRILTLSKLESGLKNFHTLPVNLAKIISEVAGDANFELTNQTKKVEIIESEKIIFKGNESLLHSAIENVVRNAVKHSDENSNVEISLKKEEEKAVIKVRDYGGGVDENKLKDLFRPFYRADQSRERRSGGVGLGLAITERAITAHGGKVWAENAPDGGLIVTIELGGLGH